MTDYSHRPLAAKLGIKPGSTLAIVNAPDQFMRSLEPLPENTTLLSAAESTIPLDVIILFVTQQFALLEQFGGLAQRLNPAGGLWIAYPKKSAAMPTDITFESAQRVGLDAGLVDNKVCAIDATYTGLRFVIRKKDR